MILRYRSVLRVKETDLDSAEGWFEKYGDPVVLFARVVPLARSVVSIPAGATRMPLPRFALLTALGYAGWNTLLIGAGWYLGSNWQRVTDAVGSATNVALIVALISTTGLVIW